MGRGTAWLIEFLFSMSGPAHDMLETVGPVGSTHAIRSEAHEIRALYRLTGHLCERDVNQKAGHGPANVLHPEQNKCNLTFVVLY